MDEKIRKLYYGMLIIGFSLIVLCGFGTMEGAKEIMLSVIDSVETEQTNDAVQNYYFDMSEMDFYGENIVFYSHHQLVKVYAGEEEIYTFGKKGSVWGKTPGSTWNFVQIPYGTGEVRVEIEAVYTSVQGEQHEFYHGNAVAIYKSILKSSLLSMFVSALLVISGVVMIIFGVVANRRIQVARSPIYLGIFSTIFGLWSFNETDGAALLLNHRVMATFSAYLYLMMMIPVFLMFVRAFMCIEERVIWKVITCLTMINFCVCLTLQFAGIKDFKEMVLITHILMVISVLYVILATLVKIVRKEMNYRGKNNVAAFSVLIILVVVDLVFYYMGVMDNDSLGRFIFFVFVLMLGRTVIANSMKMLERDKKTQIYKEMAMIDSLTHLYNRNCYEVDIAQLEKKDKVLVANFDFNNLKICNDTMGHLAGDHCIKVVAEMIETVFAEYGKCYRVGGDEFYVLIEDGATCPIKRLMEQLQSKQQQYNAGNELFPIHIAAGYALFDLKIDERIENACNRADKMMYEDKKRQKQLFDV